MSDVSIKVEIAGGIYTLKVRNEDEQNVKQVTELINQKISEFEKNYGIKDKKDILVMVTLQLVSQLSKEKQQTEKELSTLRAVLKDVEQMLIEHKQNIQNTED